MSRTARTEGRRIGTAGVLAVVALTVASGCSKKDAPPIPLDVERTGAFLRNYADLAEAEYADSAAGAVELLAAARALEKTPSTATLDATRKAWSQARVPYAQTETYRFYGGPIDRVETLVNTWPIDEEYIESSDGKPSLVTDVARYPAITAGLLASLNMKEGETSVTTGFHAIEFLLWGKDSSADGPGDRKASAFGAPDPLGPRRAAYLVAACELLVGHLEEVRAAWRADGGKNYRAELLALPRAEALRLVVKGMGSLSGPELSGERLTVAYETRDQENEHSCFSDTTSADLAGNALGVQNVCLGRYDGTGGRKVSGPGLCNVVSDLEPALGSRLMGEIERGLAAARSLPTPFDRALAGPDSAPGRTAISTAITALAAQAEALKLAAARLSPVPAVAAR